MIRFATAVALCALATAGAGTAASPPTAADLESQIVCPVCETTLDQSTAPIALRMKAFIRTRIAAGDSEQQIKDALVAEFGSEVLAEPPGGGFGLLAWVLPLGALLAGVLAVGVLVRRWSRRRDAAPPAGVDDLDPELDRLVDEELARFDG